tara:strand:+ start:223 stop:510 length:288 start_codon:yes stop_codon:yes gene_type:complete
MIFLQPLAGEKLTMEKALRFEKRMKWPMITMFAVALVTIFIPEQSSKTIFFFVCISVYIYQLASRAIKELKLEIETLKSGASTGSVEPTSSEDES